MAKLKKRVSKDPRVQARIDELLTQGCTLEPKGRGTHDKLRFPSGAQFPIIRTSDDPRATLNWLSQLKRFVATTGLK